MSEPGLRKPASKGANLERSGEDVLPAARPLPPDNEVLIEDLTEDEDRDLARHSPHRADAVFANVKDLRLLTKIGP